MGMAAIHVGSPERRDRLWLINAFAVALLTLLGATGEALGYDRMLKSNTAKRRTHSLFRQGAMLYDLIPNMPAHRLAPLMAKYSELIAADVTKSYVASRAVEAARIPPNEHDPLRPIGPNGAGQATRSALTARGVTPARGSLPYERRQGPARRPDPPPEPGTPRPDRD